MRKLMLALLAAAMPVVASAQVYVQGYTKRDGTYVAPHYRSSPDGNSHNNYSTRGNVNPYTGQEGTKSPHSSSSSSSGSYSNPYSSSTTRSGASGSTKTCTYYSPC
jgi:hypothetical protein